MTNALAALKRAGLKNLAEIINAGNAKDGGVKLILANISKAVYAAPDNHVLNVEVTKIFAAINQDFAQLQGDMAEQSCKTHKLSGFVWIFSVAVSTTPRATRLFHFFCRKIGEKVLVAGVDVVRLAQSGRESVDINGTGFGANFLLRLAIRLPRAIHFGKPRH